MFWKAETDGLLVEDPIRELEEVSDRLCKAFWTRKEWTQYALYRMKLVSMVEIQKKSDRLISLEI